MGQQQLPEAAETICKNTYMDDIIFSVESKTEAMKITSELEKLVKPGGFLIKCWTISSIPEDGQENDHEEKTEGFQTDEMKTQDEAGDGEHEEATVEEFKIGEREVKRRHAAGVDASSADKVLGVLWDPKKDVFKFKTSMNFSTKSRGVRTGPNLTAAQIPQSVPQVLTKRMILGQVNSVYDPLGIAVPFLIKMKVQMRKLWADDTGKLGWDDPLSTQMREEWSKLFQELYEMENITFHRSIRPERAIGDPSLILFSDGSNDAYGSCAYARWKLTDGHFASRLIGAKSRVAPLKRQTIVRTELCGAVLSARLAKFIQEEMNLKFEATIFLVDSEIVRSMIQKESYGFNTFVAVRIGEIQEASEPTQWYWVSGQQNISDAITRGKRPEELGSDSEWQNGPEFLQLPGSDWPVKQGSVNQLPERVAVVLMTESEDEVTESLIEIKRISKYRVLLRITARVMAAMQRPKPSLAKIAEPPSLEAMESAEKYWIKEVQGTMKDDLETGKFTRLRPRTRGDGVIVVGSRVEAWMHISYNQQQLPLLPAGHRFSRLYVEQVHSRGHTGVSATASKVRERFWIVQLHRLAKSVRQACVICKRLDKNTEGQEMGGLPLERLKPAPAWCYTSLDYFGPFVIRGEVNKRARGKAYGVIFNCMLSRAVHLDLASDYSTPGFLQVFRRFVSLRGSPSKIFSDSGSQLIAANKELQRMIENLDQDKLREFGVQGGLTWEFTTPDAPWENGCSEALIRSVKRALQSVVGEQVLTFSELQTVLFEVANLLNERPTGREPTDIDDGTYLCPNDLLLGRASNRVPSGPWLKTDNPRRRHEFVQKLVDSFWKKWTRDYFPSLLVRKKWHTARRNVRVGDVVIVQDSNLLLDNWRTGLITQVYPGRDGLVRKADVRCRTAGAGDGAAPRSVELTRSVHRLAVLVPADD